MSMNISSNIKFNKLGIVFFDKMNKIIRIIEIGITSKDNLQLIVSLKK